MANLFSFILCSALCLQLVLCQFGFFNNQHQDQRQNGFRLPDPRRFRNTLSSFLHLRPERPNDNPAYVYPFNERPGVTNNQYDQYGRPINYNYAPNYERPQRPNYEIPNYDNVPNFNNNPNQNGFVAFPKKPSENNNEQDRPLEEDRNQPTYQNNQEDLTSETPKEENKFGETNNENSQGIPEVTSISNVPEQLSTSTFGPVPSSDSRNNFNTGFEGLFHETCETIEGEIGSCISVYDCGPFVKILQQSQTNPAAVQMLRKAHCGFQGNNPKVCCPRPGIPTVAPTPEPETTSSTTTTTTTTTAAPEPSGKSNLGDFVTALPEPPVCGVSNASFSRVVGGINAKLGDFPWVALLGYRKRNSKNVQWLCGGSLVTNRHVLTAAHCIHGHESELYLVRLGELDLASDDEGATPVDVIIKTQIKHEDYQPKAYTNDIAILVLEKEVQFTNLIRPICIPQDSELRARSFENHNPIIAGWGDTQFRGPRASLLQALQLPVVSNDFCAQAYSNYKAQVIDQRVLCAGYKKGGKDACQGDSGGPLMQPIWNPVKFVTYFYEIGVVSFGKDCALPGFPGVYTRVTTFVPWLQEKLIGPQ